MADGLMASLTSYYEILALPPAIRAELTLPARTLRTAYRRALLQNHPDKSTSQTLTSTSAPKKTIFSIDQITKAYSTLSNPKTRREYDKELKLLCVGGGFNEGGGVEGQKEWRTGIETVDLDDLEGGDGNPGGEQEGDAVWWRGCRCGDEKGFLISESDLEDAACEGEVSVGCRGCSLWLRVLFGVVEDVDGADKKQEGVE
ncbi:hypothetical protein LZ554_002719 [Drepanopeziza brunnea f. sp. 'monogermtubi']|nr:hypothetical protein LZ554_002719 [Drepanopeziza brunnea f. sp. 'monogermtubi']